MKTVNACIQFVPALDGKALFTVEDLRQPNGDLHPVQQAMVDCHGSQCGFCTPGIRDVAVGALPRASAPGKAGRRSRDSQRAHRKSVPLHRVSADPRCRPSACSTCRRCRSTAMRCAGSSSSIARKASLAYEHGGRRFFAPRTVAELDGASRRPSAGDDSRRQHRCRACGSRNSCATFRKSSPSADVDELKLVHEGDGALRIGAGASLTDAYGALGAALSGS